MILLFGNGQVGWELRRSLLPLGPLLVKTRNEIDFTNLDHLRACLENLRPSIVINATAYTAVDQAESDEKTAFRVNAEAVGALAETLAKYQGFLVHYSTDYVFDGKKETPYQETDVTCPVNVYGRSKRDGEDAIRAQGGAHMILRTAWVYGRNGQNFPKKILAHARKGAPLTVVADQVGAPTSAELIADVTSMCLFQLMRNASLLGMRDTFHLTASGAVSWHGFARNLIATARDCDVSPLTADAEIHPVSSEAYPTPAHRPRNSRLDTRKIQEAFGVSLPDWEPQAARFARLLCNA